MQGIWRDQIPKRIEFIFWLLALVSDLQDEMCPFVVGDGQGHGLSCR